MVTNGKLMKSAVHLTMDLQALIRPRWSDSKLVSHSCKTKLEGLKMCLYFAPRLLRMRMALVSKSLSHETRLLACSPPTVTHRNPHQPCLSTSGAVAGSWLLVLLRAPPAGLMLELRIVLQPFAISAGPWGTWWIPSSEEDVTCPGPQEEGARTGIRAPQSPGARHVLALKLSTSSNHKIQPDGDSLLLSGPVLGGLTCAKHGEDPDSSFCV